MAKLSLSNIGPMDNRIINGDFDIWQRGTSFAPAVNGAFQTDRWEYQNGSDAVNSILQSTDVPTFAESGHTSKYSLKVDCTTADSAVAATDYVIMIYRMEGLDVSPLIGKTITVSFWVKSTKTGVFTVSFYNSSTSEGYPVEYTVNASDTWEKKTVSVLLPTTESWTTSNAVSLTVYFTIMSGSDFQMTPDTWNAGYAIATSNQVNGMDNTANNFLLSQVKMEVGYVATPFTGRLYTEELALCQRYFEKSFLYATTPADAAATPFQDPCVAIAATVVRTGYREYKVLKRTTPTMAAYYVNLGGAGAGDWSFNMGIWDSGAVTLYSDDRGVNASIAAAGLTFGDTGIATGHWTADAEL